MQRNAYRSPRATLAWTVAAIVLASPVLYVLALAVQSVQALSGQ